MATPLSPNATATSLRPIASDMMPEISMTHPSDPIDGIAAAWCLREYPHKEWAAMREEERGWWRQDVIAILAAIEAAGYTLTLIKGETPCAS
jgi:hypothetical protein